jgi:PPOX class probable F420-dependent enzyme
MPSHHLPEPVRAFLDVPRIAVLAVVRADGSPLQAPVWYRREADDRILVNSRDGRSWPAALRRDGRCSLTVKDDAGYAWVGLSCRVESIGDEVDAARDDICALAERYDDRDPETLARFRSEPRVSFRLRVDRVHDHLDE